MVERAGRWLDYFCLSAFTNLVARFKHSERSINTIMITNSIFVVVLLFAFYEFLVPS